MEEQIHIYTLVFEGKTINLLPMSPDEIIIDGKAKSTDHTTHNMLAINSEIFPLSVPTSKLDIPHAQIVCLHPRNSYIHSVWDKMTCLLGIFMLPHESIYHDICYGVTLLPVPHELTPMKEHIHAAPTFALRYCKCI